MKRPVQRNFDVFINCPFDVDYRSLLYAIVFAVKECGFVARCTLEEQDSGEVRIERICSLIAQCKLAIHDISRIQLDPENNLPRFNMPLELGLFLGAKRFGSPAYRQKCCIILDTEKYRYQKYCSDIAGQDIAAHKDDPHTAIRVIRDWLIPMASSDLKFLSGARICRSFDSFMDYLPAYCEALSIHMDELTYNDFTKITDRWLRANPI